MYYIVTKGDSVEVVNKTKVDGLESSIILEGAYTINHYKDSSVLNETFSAIFHEDIFGTCIVGDLGTSGFSGFRTREIAIAVMADLFNIINTSNNHFTYMCNISHFRKL